MRLWSLHPMYLDKKAVVESWVEGLQGFDSSIGNGRRHLNHPQKERFKHFGEEYEPYLILCYLTALCELRKDIDFNRDLVYNRLIKLDSNNILDLNKLDSEDVIYLYYTKFHYEKDKIGFIPITSGQVAYEQWWLYESMRGRSHRKAIELRSIGTNNLKTHPLFYITEGEVEDWEVVR